MPRVYRGDAYPPGPAWRFVEYPTGQVFYYNDLEHANNSRIIARAWYNYHKQLGGTNVGWSHFARYLNYLRPRNPSRLSRGISYAVSDKLYGNVLRGTLPKDERVRNLLIELSGWPWE